MYGDQPANDLQLTSDGDFIIVTDSLLFRTDANGDSLWMRPYGGKAVRQTADGGFVIVGSIENYQPWDLLHYDMRLVRTDAFGDTLWIRTYGGEWDDLGHAVQQTADGGFVITGYTESFGKGGRDVWLISTDINGNIRWTRTFGSYWNDIGNAVLQTSDGGFLVVGNVQRTDIPVYRGYDVWLIRIDANGDELWNRIYGGNGQDRGLSVLQTIDGGFIVVGSTSSYGNGYDDVWLIRTDEKGYTNWTNTYGMSAPEVGFSVQQTMEGGFIIAGFTNSYGGGNEHAYLIRTDAEGHLLWKLVHGDDCSDCHERAYAVQQTDDGGFIMAGKGSVLYETEQRNKYHPSISLVRLAAE